MYKVLGVWGDIKYKYKYYANSCFVEEKKSRREHYFSETIFKVKL